MAKGEKEFNKMYGIRIHYVERHHFTEKLSSLPKTDYSAVKEYGREHKQELIDKLRKAGHIE